MCPRMTKPDVAMSISYVPHACHIDNKPEATAYTAGAGFTHLGAGRAQINTYSAGFLGRADRIFRNKLETGS